MARPKKVGMGYFPLDCQMDDKIDILKAVHGIEGFAAYIMLLQEIYQISDGELDMSIIFRWKTLGKKFGIQEENLRKIVADMLEIGLFDKAYFEVVQKLTSNGIKKRIEEVEERRNKDRKRKTAVIPVLSESIPTENIGISQENTRKSAQKERETESKEINKEKQLYAFQTVAQTDYWSILRISFTEYKTWLKAESKKVYAVFPECWTEAMINFYKIDWLGYRQAKRSKLQLKSIQTQINELAPLTASQLHSCINNSIAGGYQGLFPDKFIKPVVVPQLQQSFTSPIPSRPFRELI